MENKYGKRLWDPNTQIRELRRPCANNDGVNNSNSRSELAEKSTLSVEAKEWYPPGYQSPNSPTQQNHHLNPNEVVHHHHHHMHNNSSVQSRLNRYRHQPNRSGIGMQDDQYHLTYLYEVIELLTIKPGKFDHVIVNLIQSLEPHFSSIDVVSKCTAAIFRQALNEPNFQYSGARLFAVLDENCPFVRGCLHSLCEKELETTLNLNKLILFYAEIYSQLNYELFGNCLLKTLRKMNPSPDNVKCICQSLKLIGSKLEELDLEFMNDLMVKLDALRNKLPSSLAMLVQSVLKLRESKWGQLEMSNTTPSLPAMALAPPESPPPSDWSNDPIYYGPDGQQLTSEETEFLAESLNDLIFDDSDPDALWNPEPEMNEEIQAAFAEFVRENNR